MNYYREFAKGIWEKNPILILGIGMCPTLAVSTSVSNALWMTLAATFVLIFSNIIVSLVKSVVPSHIRIPIFIAIIATFVIIVELTLKAFQPDIYKSLGIFIPLIVVNCIILGRAEAFASKNSVFLSIADGIGMGLGFTLALLMIGSVRELLGNGTILGYHLLGGSYVPILVMILPPGAFLTYGTLTAVVKAVNKRI